MIEFNFEVHDYQLNFNMYIIVRCLNDGDDGLSVVWMDTLMIWV